MGKISAGSGEGGQASGGGFVVFIVGRNDGLQVLSFENLIAVQAAHIVHAIAACHDFRTGVIAGLHRAKKKIIPILSM
jgi:hypothetical protein